MDKTTIASRRVESYVALYAEIDRLLGLAGGWPETRRRSCCGKAPHPFQHRILRQGDAVSARAKPATALPWEVGGHPRDNSGTAWREILAENAEFGKVYVAQGFGPDAAYIVTACNAFPQLVAALRDLLVTVDLWERGAEESERGDPERNARAILRSLGEL